MAAQRISLEPVYLWSRWRCIGPRRVEPAPCRVVRRAVKAGPGGPPVGAALTAQSAAASTMIREARQGFLRADCSSCPRSFRRVRIGGCGRPCLSRRSASPTASAARWRSGCPDEGGAAARSWSAVQQGWQQQGCGELVADHRLVDARIVADGKSGVPQLRCRPRAQNCVVSWKDRLFAAR